MTPDPVPDWAALARLRDAFLRGTAGREDYWQSESDLASYDATFAQRIGWKWDFVLQDLQRIGWVPPQGDLLDWGCGTGIATRAFLDLFGAASVTQARFFDRSPRAMEFAVGRARSRFPGLPCLPGAAGEERPPALVLVSHVLTELAPDQAAQLADRLRQATAVIWVEPGTYEASLALVAVRERLIDQFHPVAPCTHRHRCGILAAGNEPHWCHHFADPPGAVFTDPFWGRFAHLLGIDLRSLPVSYLVLDQRPPAPCAEGTVRVLGRPRLHKADLRVLACDPAGVREHTLFRRDVPEAHRAARKDRFASLQHWSRDASGRVTDCRPIG